MSALEIAAVAVSLLSVWLTVRQNILCWPVGICGVMLYTVVFFEARLYADMGLQVIYALLSAWGWYEWLHGGENRSTLRVSRASRRLLLGGLAAGAAGSLLIGSLLRHFTDASLPWTDSSLSAFSLVAQWLMTEKKLESWLIWIVVDVIYVGMFIYKDLYLTAGLYAVFIVLAARGLVEWKRALATA